MHNVKFFVIKIKRNIIPMLFIFFAFGLFLFSKNNLPAIKKGLELWANSVVPSLFPFFVATECLMHTNIVEQIGFIFNKFMKPLFNVSGKGSFAFVMGIISGYPVGAKIACNFRKKDICSKEECERLLSFTNNSGPLFIIGTVGITMFGSSLIGILLFITHIISGICVGLVFRFWKYNSSSSDNKKLNYNSNKKNVNLSNIGEVLAESINSSISTIFMIGGFVVIFSSIISILNSSRILSCLELWLSPIFVFLNIDSSFVQGLFTGFLEITNGINLISNIHIKKLSINIIFTAFLLGFGGISVMLQVLSIISKTDLSCKPYVLGKLLHGILAGFFTYVFINFIPIFNFDILAN